MDGSPHLIHVFFLIAIFGIVGNAIFSYAMSKNYYYLAILGRIFVGITICEPITLFAVSTSAKNNVRTASAVYLKASSVIGMIMGLFVGSVVYITPFNFTLSCYEIAVKGETFQGFILFCLWTLIFGYAINSCMILPKRRKYSLGYDKAQLNNEMKVKTHIDSPGSSDSPNYEENVEGHSPNALGPFHKLHKMTEDSENTIERSDRRLTPKATSNVRIFISNWNRAMKMTHRSTSLPVCFLLLFYTSAIHEMIFNSFSLTASLHFGWNYRLSGLCLTCLSVLIIPCTAFFYHLTEMSEERAILKVSGGLHFFN